MYVLQTEQRKASQFKTTGGCFPFYRGNIFFGIQYCFSPPSCVFTVLVATASHFNIWNGQWCQFKCYPWSTVFFLLFPSIMPICAPDKHVKYSRAQCRFRGFGKYLSSKRGASLNTRCHAHSGIKTSEFCYQISQKSVENLVTHSPPFN